MRGLITLAIPFVRSPTLPGPMLAYVERSDYEEKTITELLDWLGALIIVV